MVELSIGGLVGIIIGCLVFAAALTFFLTRYFFNKQLREHPPISEKMIRAMYLSMGRKPSEAQIKMSMNAMMSASDTRKKKRK